MTKESVITGLVTAMRNKFELNANKKTTFDGIPANDDDSYATINAIKSYISGAIANFVTQSDLNNAGYLTEHQDISGKVDIAQGSGKASLNVHKLLMASGDTCISSRNSNVLPASTGVLNIILRLFAKSCAS